MALLPVTLAEVLRPWRAAGITHVLGDSGAAPGARAESFPYEASHRLAAETPADRDARSGFQETLLPRLTENPASETPAPLIPCRAETPRPEPSRWPEAWTALLRRTAPAPLVWTYPELGDDLSGRGDKARGDCLRRLIALLALPKGSSAFWPLRLSEAPAGTARADETAFFQAGLEHIAPLGIILLGSGSPSLTGLPLALRLPFTQQVVRGRLFVLLPAFAELLPGTEAVERAAVYLRTAFTGVRGLFPPSSP